MNVSRFGRMASGGIACASLLAATLCAQVPRTSDQQSTTVRQGVHRGMLDPTTGARSIRASVLIGKNIENSRQESVGKIEDIVLDANTGQLQYLAVTYGGFLGVGNKLFAVPFEAVEVRPDPDDPADSDDYILVMNVTREQLDGAEGFDKENWPSYADSQSMKGMYERYGVQPRHEVLRVPHSDADDVLDNDN